MSSRSSKLTMGLRKFMSLPVTVVLFLVGYVYYSTVFLVIEPWLSLSTASGMLNGIIFTGLGSMTLLCYALAVSKDPGRIPASYLPDLEDSAVALHEVKRKGGDMRYCQKCSNYKPPRAHHCRVCKRCVLRMDHHCVWINNCVGHYNYKAFFLFVVYVVAACMHALLLLGGSVIDDLRSGTDSAGNLAEETPPTSITASTLMKILFGVVLVPLLVAVTVLLAWHVYLLLHNKTTIEYHEGVRARWLAEKAGHHYRHPYDLGVVSNIAALLGPHVTLWLIPTATGHTGSGLQFRSFCDLASQTDSRSAFSKSRVGKQAAH